jgi:hypothetical protein
LCLANSKMIAGIKPVEVCHSDALGQRFGQGFGKILRGADAAAPSGAGGLRVRRRCEDCDHDRLPDIALRSRLAEFAGRDDGYGQPIDGQYPRWQFVSVHGDGDRELEHCCNVDRERHGRRLGDGRNDFVGRKLHRSGDVA